MIARRIFPALGFAAVMLATDCVTAPAIRQRAPTAAEILHIKWDHPRVKSLPGIRHATFPSKAVGAEVGYNIYLPDAYESERDRRFPTVYFLHGVAGHESRNVGLAKRLHRAIAAGEVKPMLMVFVNGGHNTGYRNSADGTLKVETMIIEELLPHIDATYRTVANRKGRAIEGFSMGGAGALRLALKYPDKFSSVVVYAGGGMRRIKKVPTLDHVRSRGNRWRNLRYQIAMMGHDLQHWRQASSYYIAEQNAERIRGKLGIRIVVGTEDYSLKRTQGTQNRLDELKFPHEYELVGGVQHRIRNLYGRAGIRGLRFHQRWFDSATAED